jgi:acetoacetyl-CoA synthetase
MGSAEIYSVVDTIWEIEDSLVVEFAVRPGQSLMPLFVKLRGDCEWSLAIADRIRAAIRTTLTPRHLPDAVVPVMEIPKTLNGKKLEVPIKRILSGEDPETVVNVDSMLNPASLSEYVDYAQSLRE